LLTAMPLSALNVKLLLDQLTGAATVILPWSVPMPLVETITLPVPRAVCSVVLAIVASFPLAVNVPPLSIDVFLAASVIAISNGSRSQVPAWPAGACAPTSIAALLLTPSVKQEVSTNPPSPRYQPDVLPSPPGEAW